MLIELVCLAGGMIPGRLLKDNKKAKRLAALATTASICALLFIMGGGLGGNDALFGAMGRLGLQGVAISFFCTIGSVICVLPAQRWFSREPASRQAPAGSLASGFFSSLYIPGCFCLGLVLARLDFLPLWATGSAASLGMLWVMLFCVGMGMGFNMGSLMIVREMGFRLALIPILGILGTGLGAVLAALVLPGLQTKEAALVGAGFGYYSLSSVLISNHGLAALGSVALVSNVFREIFTLLFTPVLARLFGPLAPVASAGATGMDICLPVVAHFAGERYGVISFFNGLALTMLVPFLVPLVLLLF